MSRKNSTKVFVTIAILSALFGGFIRQEQAQGGSEPAPQVPTNITVTENFVFLPLVGKGYPAPPRIYGVATFDFSQWKLDRAIQANVSWLHNGAFSWATIEPTEPNPIHTYNWDAVDNAGLIEAYNHNLTVIADINYTPVWARMPKYSAYLCGAIDVAALDDYYTFVYNLVLRYSAPPYNIHYYEFGSEPEMDSCWGDASDPYHGGGYYAEMLKHAYPAVKAASPQSQVLIGGLLLLCDPTHPPAGETCSADKFFEGILRNQGAAYFDILSFHGYSGYSQGKIIDETNWRFAARGGQIVGKVDFLRSVMAQYGVNKPLMMTETALNCWYTDECDPPNDTFLQLQADYVVSAYVRSWGLGLLGAIWYTLEDSGWQQTGLHSADQTSRPAYNAYVFMTKELNDANIGSPITQFTGLRGYEFTKAGKHIWVLWAPDGFTGQSISLPDNVSQIYDKYGEIVPISSPITIIHPIYIEFLY